MKKINFEVVSKLFLKKYFDKNLYSLISVTTNSSGKYISEDHPGVFSSLEELVSSMNNTNFTDFLGEKIDLSSTSFVEDIIVRNKTTGNVVFQSNGYSNWHSDFNLMSPSPTYPPASSKEQSKFYSITKKIKETINSNETPPLKKVTLLDKLFDSPNDSKVLFESITTWGEKALAFRKKPILEEIQSFCKKGFVETPNFLIEFESLENESLSSLKHILEDLNDNVFATGYKVDLLDPKTIEVLNKNSFFIEGYGKGWNDKGIWTSDDIPCFSSKINNGKWYFISSDEDVVLQTPPSLYPFLSRSQVVAGMPKDIDNTIWWLVKNGDLTPVLIEGLPKQKQHSNIPKNSI